MDFTSMVEYFQHDTPIDLRARRTIWPADEYIVIEQDDASSHFYFSLYRRTTHTDGRVQEMQVRPYLVTHDDICATDWSILTPPQPTSGYLLHKQYLKTFWGSGGDSTTHFTWERLPLFTQQKWEQMATDFLAAINSEGDV